MNVEEMIEKIRQLSVVGRIGNFSVVNKDEYLVDIKIERDQLKLIFTEPPVFKYTEFKSSDEDIDF